MTNFVKKLPSGESIFQTTNDFNLDSLKTAIGTATKPGVLLDEDAQDYLDAPYLSLGYHQPLTRGV